MRKVHGYEMNRSPRFERHLFLESIERWKTECAADGYTRERPSQLIGGQLFIYMQNEATKEVRRITMTPPSGGIQSNS